MQGAAAKGEFSFAFSHQTNHFAQLFCKPTQISTEGNGAAHGARESFLDVGELILVVKVRAKLIQFLQHFDLHISVF